MTEKLYHGSPQDLKMLLRRLNSSVEESVTCIFGKVSIKDCKFEAAKSDTRLKWKTRCQKRVNCLLTCIQNSISDEDALKFVTSIGSLEVEIQNETQRQELVNGSFHLRILILRISIHARS